MVTSFIRYLFKKIWFLVFQIKMKNEKWTSNLNFNVQLFWKSKNHFQCVKSVQLQSFLWSVFSRMWTEYREILCISPYSVRMQENTDQKKLCMWTLFPQCLFYVLCLNFSAETKTNFISNFVFQFLKKKKEITINK